MFCATIFTNKGAAGRCELRHFGHLYPLGFRRTHMKYWTLRVGGFIVGAMLATGIEVGLLLLVNELSGRDFMPRGPGWLLLPIGLGIAVSAAAPEIWLRIERGDFSAVQKFRSASVLGRAAIVFSLFWVLCVGAYVWLFEPYGYMGDSDYSHMYKIMLFPVAVVWAGLFVYKRFIASSSSVRAPDET